MRRYHVYQGSRYHCPILTMQAEAYRREERRKGIVALGIVALLFLAVLA